MKIGFMGGTFSPPHKGHLHSAKVFIEEAELDRLIIIPAGVSPFKIDTKATASDIDRLEMAKLCFLPLSNNKCEVTVSDMEMRREGASFTIDTINTLKELHPDNELYMFVGSDMFLSLERWKNSEEIFQKCRIYTRCRENGERDVMISAMQRYKENYGATVLLSDDKEIVVSSTDVRTALGTKNFKTCQNLLTDSVLEYIIKGGLYFGCEYI